MFVIFCQFTVQGSVLTKKQKNNWMNNCIFHLTLSGNSGISKKLRGKTILNVIGILSIKLVHLFTFKIFQNLVTFSYNQFRFSV